MLVLLYMKLARSLHIILNSNTFSKFLPTEWCQQIGHNVNSSTNLFQLHKLHRWKWRHWNSICFSQSWFWIRLFVANFGSCNYRLLVNFNGEYFVNDIVWYPIQTLLGLHFLLNSVDRLCSFTCAEFDFSLFSLAGVIFFSIVTCIRAMRTLLFDEL